MQVIAHRMNTLALARQALDLGCDFVEIDLWGDRVRRAAGGEGEPLDDFLSLPVGLYVDVKGGDPSGALAGRERTVVWSADLAALAAMKGVCVMPQAVCAADLQLALRSLSPKYVAFDDRDFIADLVSLAKSAGAQVFVDRLRENDNPWKWEEAQAMGADGIQTDRPRELLKWLGR